MANLDLTKYGITGTTEIVHNPSYDCSKRNDWYLHWSFS